MSILDIIIIIFIALGFLAGFKRGIIKQGVITVGTTLVVVLAFLLKNPLSLVLYKHLPFFTVGILGNFSSLNILLYELISFFILFSIFSLIFAIVVKVSGLIERLVRATVILALPSKILGGILGLIEMYVVAWIILFIISMPVFSISSSKFITESKLKDKILNNTLIISHINKDLINSIDDVNELLERKDEFGEKLFNCKAINIFKKNNIITGESIEYLKENNKIDKDCKIE